MRYAFMSFSCPELSLGELLALAVRLGYDGIEPRMSSGHAHGLEFDAAPGYREEARDRAAQSEVALACIATSCRFADPETTAENIADAHRAVDLAGDVGCARIRVFGGRLPEGGAREEAVHRVAGALLDVAPHAAERGVTVCMETHDAWCDPADVAAVMEAVNHPAVAVNWDIMHPVRTAGVSMAYAFKTLRPWIRHVHFHDGVSRGDKLDLCPIGEGDIDHRQAVELLVKEGYPGYLSGEWINWSPCEEHLPRELATMKRYESQAG